MRIYKSNSSLSVRIYGKFAHFEIPVFAVSRRTYQFPTVSAIRGILQNIYYKPEMDYIIDRIVIQSPIKTAEFAYNELFDTVKNVCGGTHYRISEQVLVNPDYIVGFKVASWSGRKVREHEERLKRRLKKGHCFRQPFLGRSKWPAVVRLYTHAVPLKGHSSLLYRYEYDGVLIYPDYLNTGDGPVYGKIQIIDGVIEMSDDLLSLQERHIGKFIASRIGIKTNNDVC